MSHFIYWSKICHILLLVENMSHFITCRKYVPFYFWSKICPLLYWSKKCPSKKCPSKKRPSKKRPGAWCTINVVKFGVIFPKMDNDWIRNGDLWDLKQPLCQLSHSKYCPLLSFCHFQNLFLNFCVFSTPTSVNEL